MDSFAPAQTMLHRTDSASSHSTRPAGRATQTAFSSYGFGPLDGSGSKRNTGVKPVSGYVNSSPVGGSGSSWLTQVQSALQGRTA